MSLVQRPRERSAQPRRQLFISGVTEPPHSSQIPHGWESRSKRIRAQGQCVSRRKATPFGGSAQPQAGRHRWSECESAPQPTHHQDATNNLCLMPSAAEMRSDGTQHGLGPLRLGRAAGAVCQPQGDVVRLAPAGDVGGGVFCNDHVDAVESADGDQVAGSELAAVTTTMTRRVRSITLALTWASATSATEMPSWVSPLAPMKAMSTLNGVRVSSAIGRRENHRGLTDLAAHQGVPDPRAIGDEVGDREGIGQDVDVGNLQSMPTPLPASVGGDHDDDHHKWSASSTRIEDHPNSPWPRRRD